MGVPLYTWVHLKHIIPGFQPFIFIHLGPAPNSFFNQPFCLASPATACFTQHQYQTCCGYFFLDPQNDFLYALI